jgi:hypothetical protein
MSGSSSKVSVEIVCPSLIQPSAKASGVDLVRTIREANGSVTSLLWFLVTDKALRPVRQLEISFPQN